MNILSVFDNIKLPIKMMIIGILAFTGLVIPTYFYAQSSVGSQVTSASELRGIKPSSDVVILKKLTAEHRGMSARLFGGDNSVVSPLTSKAVEINSHLNKIRNAIEQALEEDDNTDKSALNQLSLIDARWKQLRAKVETQSINGKASFVEHSALLNEQDALISDLLKVFQLSYDPTAASYHTIIATFVNLPRLSSSMGKVRGASAGALSAGTIDSGLQSTINSYVTAIEQPVRDLAYNLKAAGDADSRFIPLSQQAKEINNEVQGLIEVVKTEVLREGELSYDSARMFNQFSQAINQLYDVHDKSIILLETTINERVEHESAVRTQILTLIAILFVISCLIAFVIIRGITQSANKLIVSFGRMSKQDFDIDFNTARKDEMGVLERSLSELNQQLKDAAVVAIEAASVKQALDSSSMCFMMSNKDREIVYMNDAVKKLMVASEAAIKKDLPQFNAATLIGTRIDSFHHNPAHQHAVLDQLKTTHTARLDLGGRSFQLNINPIRDEKGNDLGNSVEWLDMTEIFEEERRVARVLEALNSSSTNIMIANAQRDVIYMNVCMADLMKEAESDLRKVLPNFEARDLIGNSMDRLHVNPKHQESMLENLKSTAVNDIKVGTRHFRLITNPIYSDKKERIGTVVEWEDRTKEVNAESEIANMVASSLRGDFTVRIDEANKEGFLKTMSEGLNKLVTITESGLNEVSNVLLSISQGDLTKRIDTEYEGTFDDLKNYCNSTSENLASVISKIRIASDTINDASSEIAQGNADLSTRTEQQASSLEETASSMEEITSTVRLNAENASQANGLASKAAQVASNGGDLIQEVVVTMASINESSQKISDIIGVIDGIAFQTNILALNAAVEAARAGEQGRGFAVVASEVRTLAQRSANAAKDIKDLISDSVSKVASGNNLVNQSGETMKELVTAIQRVNDIMSEIAAASAEQASGIDEVSKAVTQMDEMTQQNAALVEEAAAAAESMRSQAGELNERVGTFKLDDSQVTRSESKQTHTQLKRQAAAPKRVAKKDHLSQQFDELPSVLGSSKALPSASDIDDEWESF